MSVRDLSELAPAVETAVRDYLRAVEDSLCSVAPELVSETLGDVTAHLKEALDRDTTLAEAAAVLAELGEPDTYAAELCSVLGESAEGEPEGRSARVLGVPYEFSAPTARRVASRWWDPTNPSILVPRVFGVGWDLNFGALAVRLGMIEPDAEDEPFASTPESSFLAALAVPVALLLFVVGSYLLNASTLPARLPVHWGIDGRADNWAPAMWAYLPLAFFAASSTVWATWSTVMHRPPLLRGAVLGFATFLSGLSAAVWALTLLSVDGIESPWLPFVLILVSALVLPLIVLTALARAGRNAEIARDLDEKR